MKRILPVLLLCCSVSALALVPPRDPSRRAEWQEQLINRSDIARMPAAEQAVGQRTIIPRILVIMANFTDYELVSSAADVDSMFNAVNWTKDGATGSVRQYFYDQSMGQYNPQFDIVGPVTLSNGYAYYGGGCNSTTRAGYMVTEACALVDEQVDFTEYDSNNDGKVDLVYVFFAGFGENDPPQRDSLIPVTCELPWPHYWNVVSAGYGSNPREFDGKKIYDYEISNELDGYYSTKAKKVISGIGVVCHEFGHALGLPDTYSTGSGAHDEKLLGSWDIMCYGPYNNDMHTPPSYTAYERFYMGWLTPELITKGDTLTLENIAETNKAYLICETDTHNLNGLQPDPETFYLLENNIPEPQIFNSYLGVLRQLAGGAPDIEVLLRNFELELLDNIGYGIDFISDYQGNRIRANVSYVYEPDNGFIPVTFESNSKYTFIGADLASMSRREFGNRRVLSAIKHICKKVINSRIGNHKIYTRALFAQYLAMRR